MRLDIRFIAWFASAALVYYFFGGYTWSALLIMTIVLFCLAGLQGLLINRGIGLTFEDNEGRTEVGDVVSQKLIIGNRTLLLAPRVEVTAANQGDRRVFSVPPRDKVRVVYKTTPKVRGIVSLGKITLTVADALNIIKWKRDLMPVTTKIYPKILERDAEKLAYDTLGEGNFYRTYSRENPYVIRELRRYRMGDNIRKINWKVSAKFNELYVKKGETTEEKDILIILDMNERIMGMDREGIYENTLVTDALSLSRGLLKIGIPHGVILNDNRRQSFDMVNREAFERLEEDLLETKAVYRHLLKDFVIEKNEFLLERGTLVFFTTYDPGSLSEIRRLKHDQNEVVLCVPKLDNYPVDPAGSKLKFINLKGAGYEVD